MVDLKIKGTVIIFEDDLDGAWWVSSLPADRFYDLIAEVIQENPFDFSVALNQKLGNLARRVETDFTTSPYTILINQELKTIAVGSEKLMIVDWDSFLESRMEKA